MPTDIKITLNSYNGGSTVISGKASSIRSQLKIPPQFWFRVIDYKLEGQTWIDEKFDSKSGKFECMGEEYDLSESSCSFQKNEEDPNEITLKLTLIRPPEKLFPYLC
ncbi:hypothetical protein ACTFIR_012765 [Dictyostelium discoideum]